VTEAVANEKALEEKVSNTTIRPPSILIPEFHHKPVDVSPTFRLKDEKSNGELKEHDYTSNGHALEKVGQIHNDRVHNNFGEKF
jgi:hypothetical protein